jgi:hydroxypyruvate reductase
MDEINRIFVIGFGKAVIPMAHAVFERLRGRITAGVLVAKHIKDKEIISFQETIRITCGEHPVPNEKSIEAAKMIIQMLKLADLKGDDLIITLISGGGSSLVTLPREPVSISNLLELTRELLRSGATINEINTIRKHLDEIKGGGLLKSFGTANSANLILSDVIGDDLSVIASGPTSLDPSTYSDAINILNKYDLWKDLNGNIRHVLGQGADGKLPETIKENDPLLTNAQNWIVGSLEIAAQAAKLKAHSLGYQCEIYKLNLKGEAKVVGTELANYIKSKAIHTDLSKKPLCIIAGGETTVTIHGSGKGGRNQELALAAALELKGSKNIDLVTLATDGEDGPTDAAGVHVNGQTIGDAELIGLNAEDFLRENDSYHFFEKTGELIRTGPTGTNVNDLVLMFAY